MSYRRGIDLRTEEESTIVEINYVLQTARQYNASVKSTIVEINYVLQTTSLFFKNTLYLQQQKLIMSYRQQDLERIYTHLQQQKLIMSYRPQPQLSLTSYLQQQKLIMSYRLTALRCVDFDLQQQKLIMSYRPYRGTERSISSTIVEINYVLQTKCNKAVQIE